MTYKTFFIPSESSSTTKFKMATSYIVDGLDLSRKIQSLLSEHSKEGYSLAELESITSTAGFTYTEGVLIVLKKEA